MSNLVQNTTRPSTSVFPGSVSISNYFGGKYIAPDALKLIFSLLQEPRDAIAFGLASRGLYQLFLSPLKWDSFVQKYFPDSYKDWKLDVNPHLLSGIQGQNFYKHFMGTKENTEKGKYRPHTESDFQWVKGFCVHDGDLYVGGASGSIKVYDLKKGKELRKFSAPGHIFSIFCIGRDTLYVGSAGEAKIIAFDLKSGKEKTELSFQGPPWSNKVTKICAYKNYLCATFLDNFDNFRFDHIMIWNLENGEEYPTLSSHKNVAVDDFCIHEDNLYAGLSAGHIEIFSLENGKRIHTLHTEQNETVDVPIFYLQVRNGHLHSCSLGGTFKIWDLKCRRELQKIQLPLDDGDVISCLYEHNHFIYFGCKDVAGNAEISDREEMRDLNVYDLMSGKTYKVPCFLEPSEDNLYEFCDLYAHKDNLFVCASDTLSTMTLKFNSFFPSRNEFDLLENNLTILENMIKASSVRDFTKVTALVETLHPKFKNCLLQHCFKTKILETMTSITVILRVYTEMSLEGLLKAVHCEDSKRVSQILDNLASNDPVCVAMLCRSLEQMVWGQTQSKKKAVLQNREIWDLASRIQKEKAVSNCKQSLIKKWGKDLPFLLAHLGIVHPVEYTNKLGCPSEHLTKIGISSLEDLKALGISCPPPLLEMLNIDIAIDSGKDPRTASFERKIAISKFLQTSLNHVNAKVKETENFSVVLYEKNNPWLSIQQALIGFQEGFEKRAESSKLPKDFLEAFSLEACLNMAFTLNSGYLNQIHDLDRKHQIAKLRAYVHQFGILKAWETIYRPARIYTLAELAARPDLAPKDFHQMGI